jgi:hypothetical protein
MKTIKQHIIDYKKPTPVRFRKMGDFALLMLVTIQSAIAAAPEEILSTKQSYWLGTIMTLIVVGFKFWTNTQTDENMDNNSN